MFKKRPTVANTIGPIDDPGLQPDTYDVVLTDVEQENPTIPTDTSYDMSSRWPIQGFFSSPNHRAVVYA